MKTRFNHKAYRRRAQIETVMSMLKRNFGQALRGRTYHSRRRDMFLMCLTHNVAILLLLVWRGVFYRASSDPFSVPKAP
jgi:transposase